IFHVEGLAEGLRQRLRDDVRQHGSGTAGRERHDDPHGPRRIILRRRNRGDGQRRGGAGEAQKATTKRLHDVALARTICMAHVRSTGKQKIIETCARRRRHRPLEAAGAKATRPAVQEKAVSGGAVGNPDVRRSSELAKRKWFCGSRSIEWWWMQSRSNRSQH